MKARFKRSSNAYGHWPKTEYKPTMSDMKKKLAALKESMGLTTGADLERRNASEGTPPKRIPTPCPPTPRETSEGVRSLRDRLDLLTGSDWAQEHTNLEKQRLAGDFEIDKVVPGEVIGDDEGGFYLVRRDYPLDYSQGRLELGAALETSSEQIALSACDEELLAFDPRRTVFMDTETTGLAGGTGTVAFLVGVGYFHEDAFRLDQYFMRDYDDEEPMLAHLGELFARFETVAGYNSKSFDQPLLRSRFVQNRLPFRLERCTHYDLVHAARRVWKRRLSDCSLGNVEREVLGIERHGDVPSYLIPQLWFDYINTRDARPLEGVFYHHRMDILSLVTLTGWISKCLSAPNGQGFEHDEDRLSVVRLHFRQKNYTAVIEHGNALFEGGVEDLLRRELLEMMAMAHKRQAQWVEMQETWELLLQEFPRDLNARLELAKHHEHRTRNLPRAEELCAGALDQLETRLALGAADPADEQRANAFRQRLERIRRKLAKARHSFPGDED